MDNSANRWTTPFDEEPSRIIKNHFSKVSYDTREQLFLIDHTNQRSIEHAVIDVQIFSSRSDFQFDFVSEFVVASV